MFRSRFSKIPALISWPTISIIFIIWLLDFAVFSTSTRFFAHGVLLLRLLHYSCLLFNYNKKILLNKMENMGNIAKKLTRIASKKIVKLKKYLNRRFSIKKLLLFHRMKQIITIGGIFLRQACSYKLNSASLHFLII